MPLPAPFWTILCSTSIGDRPNLRLKGDSEKMSVLLVTYDLDDPNRNYSGLIAAIKRRTYCHALDSVWFLDTFDDPADVRNELSKELDGGDQLYVFRLRKHWAAHKKDAATEWLKSDKRSWD